MPLLDEFKITGSLLDPDRQSYYSNVTGFIHGDVHFYNITPVSLSNNETLEWRPLAQDFMADSNMTDIAERMGVWNWTASNKVALSVVEKRPLQASGNATISTKIALVHVSLGMCLVSPGIEGGYQ